MLTLIQYVRLADIAEARGAQAVTVNDHYASGLNYQQLSPH